MEKFKSDQVEVTLKRSPGCEVEMAVSVSPAGCQAAYEQAVKEVRKRVSIPGFRKGKAPDDLIRKQYQAAIEQQWQDTIVNVALREALSLTSAYPWQSGSVPPPKVDSCTMDGAEMTFRYESEPSVPEIDPTTLSLKKIDPTPVIDKQIEEELARVQKELGTPKVVENHSAALGDYVRLTIESLEKDPPEKVLDNHLIELKKGEIGAWLIDSLLKKRAGETYTATSAADEEASEDFKKNFKPVDYRITVNTVEQLQPPTDEELLSKVGQPSMEAFRKTIRERFEREAQQEAHFKQTEALWDHLMNEYPFDLPKSLIAEDKRLEIRRLIDQARRQGVPDEQIRSEEKKIESQAEANVQRRFYAFFLSRKILRELNRLPTDKEMTDRALQTLQWEAIASGNFAALRNPPKPGSNEMSAYRNQAFLILTQEKAEEHLLSKAHLS
ncbi:MAG: trigger factor [Parachlamydiales bacterium]